MSFKKPGEQKMEEKKKSVGVGFWKKESGNAMSSSGGLSAEELEFLKSLQVGDRLILWGKNEGDHERSPDYRMKKYLKKL